MRVDTGAHHGRRRSGSHESTGGHDGRRRSGSHESPTVHDARLHMTRRLREAWTDAFVPVWNQISDASRHRRDVSRHISTQVRALPRA